MALPANTAVENESVETEAVVSVVFVCELRIIVFVDEFLECPLKPSVMPSPAIVIPARPDDLFLKFNPEVKSHCSQSLPPVPDAVPINILVVAPIVGACVT